jgi:hypothetical protein
MSNPTPNFYAIIPAHVRYCKGIEPGAKLLYGELTALAQAEGYCWASNKYFADLYGVEERTIQRWLSSLKDLNFIAIQNEKQGIHWQRKIFISVEIKKMFTKGHLCQGGVTNLSGDHDKNVTQSNTISNTYEYKEKEINKEKERGEPPPNPLPLPAAGDLFSLFLTKLKERNPGFKKPNESKWLKEFELLLRVDKRDLEEAKKLIEWAATHEFWKSNCLSPANLRKSYDRMLMQMNAQAEKAPSENIAINKQHVVDIIGKYPHRSRELDFQTNYVARPGTGKDVSLNLPPESFRMVFLALLGGSYEG